MDNTAPAHPIARLRQPQGGVFLLYAGRSIKLGRSCENDVVLNEPKISRFHALLEWTGSGFVIRDLGSINGTQVNRERLPGSASRTLRDGDEIMLNKYVLIFEIVRVESSEPITEPLILGNTACMHIRGPRLVVLQGPDAGGEYPLWGERVTIGRSSREVTCEIRLSDPTISCSHISIEQCDDGYYLVDLNSVNGTLLNGVRLEEPTRLHTGDQIEIGQTCLVFYPRI